LEGEIIELKEENEHLRNQLDQAYKAIANLKGEMILVRGEADRAKSQLKRQTKNNDMHLDLDKFCKKRLDSASPDEALSQLENNSSLNRRQQLSSHTKV
jgi:hypothetical protein